MYRLRRSVRLRKGPRNSYWAFCLESGEHFELNSTAYEVLTQLGGGADLEEIAKYLSEEYGVELDAASTDVRELLNEATEHGLVEEEGVTDGREEGQVL